MDFGNALSMLKSGCKMSRTKWNNIDDAIVFDKDNERFTRRIRIHANDKVGAKVGWTPTAEDMLAQDWEICR